VRKNSRSRRIVVGLHGGDDHRSRHTDRHTHVDLAPQPQERLTLAPRSSSDSATGIDLGAHVRARVLHYVPSADARELRVSILSGSHAGLTGWVYAHTATIDDLPITLFRNSRV